MEITDVRIRKIATEGKMKAIVSITFDNEFVVHDIKVIEGQSGLFIAMPSRKTPDGEFKDIAHPINTQTREKIQTAILEEYEKVNGEEPVKVARPVENLEQVVVNSEEVVESLEK
jgi:stage V sporulation protein G